MKEVFILIDQLHSHGGIETLVSLKANYWADNYNYKVNIISTEQNGLPIIYNLSPNVNFIDLGINYNRNKSFFHPSNLIKLRKNVIELKKLIKKYNPSHIIVASHIPMTYVLPFIKSNSKTIKEFHFSKYNQANNFKERIFTWTEKFYSNLVVLSEEERHFYPSNNVKVIPNPHNKPTNLSLINYQERPNVAVAILRFSAVKNVESMISIWEEFSRKNPTWKLHLYGDLNNSYAEKIQKLIRAKNLQNHVICKGKTHNVYETLNNAKLLLLTSKHECFPMVILEAQSMGVPVVSFNVPTGPRNIISHKEDGYLIQNNNEKEFVYTLNDLVKSPQKLQKLSEKAFQKSKNYDVNMVMKLWKSLIFAD